MDELIATIKDPNGDASARRSAMESLLRNPQPGHYQIVLGQISNATLGTAARLGCAEAVHSAWALRDFFRRRLQASEWSTFDVQAVADPGLVQNQTWNGGITFHLLPQVAEINS